MFKFWLIRKTPYRETSLLATVLSEQNRLIRVVVRGGQGSNSKLSEFQQFIGEVNEKPSGLMYLNKPELHGPRVSLVGLSLVSGLYANEIMHCLLPEGGELEGLFMSYTRTLTQLFNSDFTSLRYFERLLLDASGAYPDFSLDREGDVLDASSFYRLLDYQQLVRADDGAPDALIGDDWIRLGECRYLERNTESYAKWLHRILIDRATGGRRLVSRELLAGLGSGS
ncbi:recombination protein O N-terminal domain-containing protein [Litorivicinus sp.]|nr:recombination protein O N-terminal domain-containing protein [Litorivicinus sp.]MDC1207817.1 recombination protein O N-terminal domain-containing protein [Litorivicinus sp.]MDC1239703.1 recombination protein O N-terminal domain-containing protein [Litorivicinus sp.]MDC1467053.1 recombination protein O N-terminal domain-containing protein [Litorivicinus sp.]